MYERQAQGKFTNTKALKKYLIAEIKIIPFDKNHHSDDKLLLLYSFVVAKKFSKTFSIKNIKLFLPFVIYKSTDFYFDTSFFIVLQQNDAFQHFCKLINIKLDVNDHKKRII